ncbi:MAG: hypothetical protein KJ941_11180 [Bacteroidetes bacterium]|nr:hypothetical protein [Bacteroidota bacterium]
MLSPGSKGWINKYFDLIENQKINLKVPSTVELNHREGAHYELLKSGIVFGFPADLIFAKHLETKKWTSPEKLKVQLFESFLLIYEQERGWTSNSKELFIAALVDFYANHNAKTLVGIFSLFKKESKESRLEKVFSSRLEVKAASIFEGNYWLSYLSNTFIYLDVILFREYLKNRQDVFSNYRDFAFNTLKVLAVVANSDGEIQENEKTMFDTFLFSSGLSETDKDLLRIDFEKGSKFQDLPELHNRSWLYRRYLMDVSALMLFASESWQATEDEFFDELCNYLGLPKKESNIALALIDNFVLQHSNQLEFLNNRSNYEKMYGNLTRRWIKVLGRNKDKLAKELKESKELVSLISKSTREELSKEEKEMVRTQFLDIIKSMPALAIFMLPGGALLLPLILKVLPDLIPSAFRDNELEKND